MAQRQNPPYLESFKEVSSKTTEVLDWTEGNVDDYVYHFKFTTETMTNLKDINACVAGSAALSKIYDLLFSTNIKKWKPTDVDIFFLGRNEYSRMSIGMTDIVQCKEKTVEELLLNFDMPICRVAYNFNYDIWISAQCIRALYTKRQNIPKYLKQKFAFFEILSKHQKQIDNQTHDQKYIDEYYLHLYKRFAERVKKYQDRGYGVNWLNLKEIIPWITHRFHYGEWSQEQV